MTRQGGFEHDFAWQKKFAPQIKRILANHLIAEAPAEEDNNRATDFMVLRLDTIRVACRVRRHKDLERCPDYQNQFTIRSWRKSGNKTELAKVISGWGDYLFYGFAAADDSDFHSWLLGDLRWFRFWRDQCLLKKQQPWLCEPWNVDRKSRFQVYRIDDLPQEFVVDRKYPPIVVADQKPPAA